MIKTLLYLASAAMLVLAHEEVIKQAIVRLDGSGVNGNITFTTLENGNVSITGRVAGMPPGKYGFHVHEKGDITNGCNNAGPHYNPFNQPHGHPDDHERHVGDLGNIEFDQSSVAIVKLVDHQIKLNGPHNVIGRTVVLHKGEDDYGRTDHPDSKKTGNAGEKAACGVIGILKSQPAANAAATIVKTFLLTLTVLPLVL